MDQIFLEGFAVCLFYEMIFDHSFHEKYPFDPVYPDSPMICADLRPLYVLMMYVLMMYVGWTYDLESVVDWNLSLCVPMVF